MTGLFEQARTEWTISDCCRFLSVKKSRNSSKRDRIISLIRSEDTVRRLKVLESGVYDFAPPELVRVHKRGGGERNTYRYSDEDLAVMTLLAYAAHRYDSRFSPSVFSNVHTAGREQTGIAKVIRRTPGMDGVFSFRTDIRSFFDSIDGGILKTCVRRFLPSDPAFCGFLCSLIDDRRYLCEDGEHTDGPAVPSTPLSGLLVNILLYDMDWVMCRRAFRYFRYCDDILVCEQSREKLNESAELIRSFIEGKKLTVNDRKSAVFLPGEPVVYMGYEYRGNSVALTEQYVNDIIFGIRTNEEYVLLLEKRGLSPMGGLIFMMCCYQRLTGPGFQKTVSVLTETGGLRKIDRAMQDSLRSAAAGTKTGKRYNVRYPQLNGIGYKSLIYYYYRSRIRK